MHYRSCVESVAKSGSSILINRDLRQYIRELQPNNLSKELETKVSSEVLKGVLCIAKKYIKRLTSFKNCLFGKEGKCIKEEKYSNYECSDLNDYPIIVSRERLIQKIFYCGELNNNKTRFIQSNFTKIELFLSQQVAKKQKCLMMNNFDKLLRIQCLVT
jgi:hypothetical protein